MRGTTMAPLRLPAGPRAWICQIGAQFNKTPTLSYAGKELANSMDLSAWCGNICPTPQGDRFGFAS